MKICEPLEIVKKLAPFKVLFFASLFCIKLQKVFVGCCTCIL